MRYLDPSDASSILSDSSSSLDHPQGCPPPTMPPEDFMHFGLSASSQDSQQNRHDHFAPSQFEQLVTTHPPILENLLLHLPTPSIFDLYHTSHNLRAFLRSYPLAWKNLSFRLLPAAQNATNPSTSQSPDPNDSKKPYALDLLLRVILPYGSRLARLDLDNTSISGTELYARVLDPRRSTLQHLSVRGCKDVSLKYHILPFLQVQMAVPTDVFSPEPFALKSLYAYRCRHHRRRPYFPSSLTRRDSDSQPTHQLIEICHALGIWTDTAWCPTPGPRCYRRKDYYTSKLGAGGTEVWVPFDRLWRSQNMIGPAEVWSDVAGQGCPSNLEDHGIGRLWEDSEYGYGGEALGSKAEGKELPMHLRTSHKTFIDGFSCYSCKDRILERCEQCSVGMHCMGCRVTLCHSCAFDRPLRRKRQRVSDSQQHQNLATGSPVSSYSADSPLTSPGERSTRRRLRRRRDPFWWAPGERRNPNLLHESQTDGFSSSDDDLDSTETQQITITHAGPHAPKLDMHWCCLKPCFTGGGGIGFNPPLSADGVRASPLPHGRGFEDPEFAPSAAFKQFGTAGLGVPPVRTDRDSFIPSNSAGIVDVHHYETPVSALPNKPGQFDIMPYLEQSRDTSDVAQQRWTSPRSLCRSCYNSTNWRILCSACRFPICIEHDLKRLKVRKCGYRKLEVERALIQQSKECLRSGQAVPKPVMESSKGFFYAKWRPIVASMARTDEYRRLQGKWTPRPDGLIPTERVEEAKDQASPHAPPSTWQLRLFSRSPDLQHRINEYLQRLHGPQPSLSIKMQEPRSTYTQERPQIPRSISVPSLRYNNSSPTFFPDSHVKTRNFGGLNKSCFAPRPRVSNHSIPIAPWTGCGRYFCPSRSPGGGDPRPMCLPETSTTPCSMCHVHVCVSCAEQAPKCNCRSCQARGFLCPNCMDRGEVRTGCRRLEEDEARRAVLSVELQREDANRRVVQEEWEHSREEREAMDSLAEGVAGLFEIAEAQA